jgi:hypothetical protein
MAGYQIARSTTSVKAKRGFRVVLAALLTDPLRRKPSRKSVVRCRGGVSRTKTSKDTTQGQRASWST